MPVYTNPFQPLILTFLDFRIVEGTSLTLFGLFTYDSISDSFTATDLNTFFAGGIPEIKRILTEKVERCQDMNNFLNRLFGVCLFMGGLALYWGLERQIRKLRARMNNKNTDRKVSIKKLSQC